MVFSSKAVDDVNPQKSDWKYPPLSPYKEGYLKVSETPPHEIHWETYGNPEGEPAIFFHGGPGGATSPDDARFFDPARYRIILFDQRGCGKSLPHAAKDPQAALKNNTTDHLIEDINKLRDALNITGKMHVLGGSWGSTLALAYAIKHPDNIKSLALRGIFLCRKKDLDYFYQGNAAHYEKDPYDTTLAGAYMSFPEAWKEFVQVIPPEKRGDMVKAYAEIFVQTPDTLEKEQLLLHASSSWSIWEGVTSYLAQDISDLGKFSEPEFAKAFARIENHYFMNGAFLGGAGEHNRDNNYLLKNIDKIAHLPIRIVQGQYDQVCPRFQADELIDALQTAGAKDIVYTLTAAGHGRTEKENLLAQVAITDALALMSREEKIQPSQSK